MSIRSVELGDQKSFTGATTSVATPSEPTITSAVTSGGPAFVAVSFTASTLGPAATSYTVVSSTGRTASGASSPITIEEISDGTFTYQVRGVNANGNGPLSAPSSGVPVLTLPTGGTRTNISGNTYQHLFNASGTFFSNYTLSDFTYVLVGGGGGSGNASTGSNNVIYK